MSDRPELVLLTSAYPFGNASETFLETEIEVLAERFERVYVLPSHSESRVRPLPPNAELIEMPWLASPYATWRTLASVDAISVLQRTVRFEGRLWPYFRAPRVYVDNLARNVAKSRLLKRFVADRGLADAVFYDYWFENSTLALALLRESGVIRTAVARAHRFDLYDECWSPGVVPFRQVKARALDAVFPVSEAGGAYLGARIPALRHKIQVRHLGVADPGCAGPASVGDVPLVVTCARLEAQKRVHLVPGVLAKLDRPLRWIHFGDGPERPRVAEEASRLLSRGGSMVEWELRGQVDNRDVLAFYEANHVDVLLSLSSSEGLPVSMMEAQSYGIPIVALDAGGVCEIVTDRTGVLLPLSATLAEAAAGLHRALEQGAFDSEAVRTESRRLFDAKTNYNGFVDTLLALHGAP